MLEKVGIDRIRNAIVQPDRDYQWLPRLSWSSESPCFIYIESAGIWFAFK